MTQPTQGTRIQTVLDKLENELDHLCHGEPSQASSYRRQEIRHAAGQRMEDIMTRLRTPSPPPPPNWFSQPTPTAAPSTPPHLSPPTGRNTHTPARHHGSQPHNTMGDPGTPNHHHGSQPRTTMADTAKNQALSRWDAITLHPDFHTPLKVADFTTVAFTPLLPSRTTQTLEDAAFLRLCRGYSDNEHAWVSLILSSYLSQLLSSAADRGNRQLSPSQSTATGARLHPAYHGRMA